MLLCRAGVMWQWRLNRVPLLTITLCLLQPLSQNHPSGIQPHTQLHLPEGLSLAATSLLTEVRALGGWEEEWD